MKHLKLSLALLALVLAVAPVWMATTDKEGVVEKVKHAMGIGAEEQAYEEGRDAVKGPATVIGEMKRKVEEIVAAGKNQAEGSYQEAKERADAATAAAAERGQGVFETIKQKVTGAKETGEQAAHEVAAQGHSFKERVQDMLHMGKHKAHEASEEAAAHGHGAFETIQGAADAAKGKAAETVEAGKRKARETGEALEEAYEGAAGKAGETLQAEKRYAEEAKAYGQGVKDELAAEAKHGLHKEGVLESAKRKVSEAIHGKPEPKGVMEEMQEKVEETLEHAKQKIAEL